MGQELAAMREKYRVLCCVLDERGRRVWAAAEANSLPHGGVSLVANATGLSRSTFHAGLRELRKDRGQPLGAGRSRKAGGGRKPLTFHNPDLLKALEKLVEPTTRGDPESPLRWTCKSTRLLPRSYSGKAMASATAKWPSSSPPGYSLQANAKTLEGGHHPDRNAQFEYVNAQTKKFLEQGLPVISVDTKKKELVGNYSNHGQEWRPNKNRNRPCCMTSRTRNWAR